MMHVYERQVCLPKPPVLNENETHITKFDILGSLEVFN